jgi:hypothetical protein
MEIPRCPSATVPLPFFSPSSRFQPKDFSVIRKIGLAFLLMTLGGMASAGDFNSDKCFHILWFDFCPPSSGRTPVKAPEIDPASAMAGLTLMAGGLAVLRGRRRIKLKA